MAGKCSSQNCNRKPETNDQNLCVLCYDWYQKCQSQTHMYRQQNSAHYEELSTIYSSLSSGVNVDMNMMMRALIGSMMNMMNQNQSNQILELKEANEALSENVKVLEEDLGSAKMKLFHLEYDLKELENKSNSFLPADTLVIRNLEVPQNGDDEISVVKEVFSNLKIEDLDPDEVIIKVERKGNDNGKLGSVFVKLLSEEHKRKIMKTKKELKNSANPRMKDLKIMNYKLQEQILLENSLRNVLALIPDGHLYELNGNMRLVSKKK